MSDLASSLAQLLGTKGWLTGADTTPYVRDWLNRYGAQPLGIARPASTEETSAVVKSCRAAGIPIVPQGGNTGLCGAAVAQVENAVILSTSRMAGIGKPDPASGSILVESGVVLAELHKALEPYDVIFPLHLGAEGSARIGGLIGTNAGGSQAFRYGMMGDLTLGLEVVMADGSIWDGLRAVQKDNAGYQLRSLFCGSEGTLGIVTRAVLKLFPVPRQRVCALLALPDLASAVTYGSRLRNEASEFLYALEFFSDWGLETVFRHFPELDFPLQTRGGVYVLVELTAGSLKVPLGEILQESLESAMEDGLVVDGALAMSETQRAHFWRLREEQPEGQRLEGEQLKHDISVPPGKIAEFVNAGSEICHRLLPGVRINPFGHLGDGNIHYNLTPPETGGGFPGLGKEIGLCLAQLATSMGGSFAAEHGLGRSKIGLADGVRSAQERDMMRIVKRAFDPGSQLNPGVLVREG